MAAERVSQSEEREETEVEGSKKTCNGVFELWQGFSELLYELDARVVIFH